MVLQLVQMLVVIGIFTNGEVSNTCTKLLQNHQRIQQNAVCRCNLTGMFEWALTRVGRI